MFDMQRDRCSFVKMSGIVVRTGVCENELRLQCFGSPGARGPRAAKAEILKRREQIAHCLRVRAKEAYLPKNIFGAFWHVLVINVQHDHVLSQIMRLKNVAVMVQNGLSIEGQGASGLFSGPPNANDAWETVDAEGRSIARDEERCGLGASVGPLRPCRVDTPPSAGDSAKFSLSPLDEKLLGTMPDLQVSARLGWERRAIRKHRELLGIPRFISPRLWTPREEAWLGRKTDAEIARLTGRTLLAVGMRRRALGRPNPGCKVPYFLPAEDKLLGTMPDSKAARRLKRSKTSIALRRARLGIPAIRRYPWTDKEEALLGVIPDARLAKMVGVKSGAIAKRRLKEGISFRYWKRRVWTAREDAMLGTAPDRVIAKRLKIDDSTVFYRRQKLGVPARAWAKRKGADAQIG